MAGTTIALTIAALSGIAMAFQGSLNAVLGRTVGIWGATLIVHVVGLLFVLLLYPLVRGSGGLSGATASPWYSYLGGILGALIVYGVARAIPKVGAAPATTTIIVGQMLAAGAVDHFGLFGLRRIPFGTEKLLGVLFLAVGGWLILKR